MARKILLADDSVTAQNMGRKILADAGYEVVAVNNGSAALKKIVEIKPDLVILDVYMPGYSGLEVCQRLKEAPETSRLPVLLTVGKLEPFKPEEAQRVRADAFIVKPFEASELLSALSKLEDRIVPRSEASKSGRFARAIAAVEESAGISKNDGGSEDGGWRSRIQFPKKKKAEEQPAEEEPIYNAMNRDLRTVVETPAEFALERATEKAGDKPGDKPGDKKDKKKKEDLLPPGQKAAEATLDVAAIAPPGFPKDVTPEEAAAITAAAAQIQMLAAVLKEEPQVQAERGVEAPVQVGELVASQAIAEVEPTFVGPTPTAEATPQIAAQEKNEVAVADKTAAANAQPAAEETADEPVTMAAAVVEAGTQASAVVQEAASSRWQAVAVAVEGEEASISLEQEMQKAYAAFVAEETTASTTFSPAVQAEASLIEPLAVPAQAIPETTSSIAAPIEVAPVETLPEPEPVPVIAAEQAEPSVVAPPEPIAAETVAVVDSAAVAEPGNEPVAALEVIAAETAAVEDLAVTQAPPETLSAYATDPLLEAVAGISTPVAESQVPDLSSDLSPNPSPETVQPEPLLEPVMSTQSSTVAGEDVMAESEAAKNTAAAWASWRQIRETGSVKTASADGGKGNDNDKNGEVAAIAEAAAMAVAAGAEQAAQQATGQAETPADVASIVDGVLADLRPRLLAEISRKIAEKK